MYGINRIRLEFKERWVARWQGYVKVLIESDWNLKNGDSMVLHPELFTY